MSYEVTEREIDAVLYRATMSFRWLEVPVSLGNGFGTVERVLQQLWHDIRGGTFEWQDVPVVKNPQA